MKLIYLYIYENDMFKSTEINFSDNYNISFSNEEKSKIEIKKMVKKNSIEKKLYSNYIENITAFVGINGIGKTSLLNYLGFQDADVSHYYRGRSYFAIYEMGEEMYFEGMEGEELFDFFDEDFEEHGYRYWAKVSYNEANEKLTIIHDKKWDYLFPEIRDEYDKIEFFYYEDNLSNGIEWIKEIVEESDKRREYDNYSLLKRNNIRNTIQDIYRFMNFEKKLLGNILKSQKNINGYLILNTEDSKRIKWQELYTADSVKSFIIQLLFNLCEGEYKTKESNELKKIREVLKPDNDSQLPSILKYNQYKKILIDIYINEFEYNREFIEKLIGAIERLDEHYFSLHEKIYVREGVISAEILNFSVVDDYNENLYEALELFSTFNDKLISYKLFDYKYDHMSAGEIKCIDIFSGVCESIRKRGKSIQNKNIILLLDEPDKGLHPELSRKFISIVNYFSEELGKQYNCTFQYIITSHSPFLMLDVPESNIYLLKKESENMDSKTKIDKGNMGIMSNIADLIKDTFFLESPFGVLSERFFKDLQNDILNLKEEYSQKLVNDIRARIDVINETSLKKYLISSLENQLEVVCEKNDLLQYYQSRIKEITSND